MNNPEYLFESFLPYRDALNLERWLIGLLQLQDLLEKDVPIEEGWVHRAHFCAHALFPDLRAPGQSEEEWKETREREEKFSALSAEEKEEKIEEDAEELRRKIDSGEIDIWDDTPRYISREEVQGFLKDSLALLKAKIFEALNPNVSFFEKRVKEAIVYIETGPSDLEKDKRKTRKGLRAVLSLWDTARIHHEGEPPYRIVFSNQVAETLGIDAKLESARLQQMRPLEGRALQRFEAAYRVAKTFLPQEGKELKALLDSVEKIKTKSKKKKTQNFPEF